MTMLTALRELSNKRMKISHGIAEFKFESYGDEVYLTEKLVFMKGAEYSVEFAWKKLNE